MKSKKAGALDRSQQVAERNEIILQVATFAGLVLLWEGLVRVLHVPSWLLPAPSGILREMWAWRVHFLHHWLSTLYEVLLGFSLSVGIGLPLAMVIAFWPALEKTILKLLVVLQSVPKVALAPLILLWVGFGMPSKVLVAFLVGFFPIVVDTTTGLFSMTPEQQDLTKLMRATRLQTFVKVQFPNALPFFFSGLKVAVTLVVIGAVIGEFVGSDVGLGYVILIATAQSNTNLAFAAIVLLSATGMILFSLVERLERWVCPWGRVTETH